MYNDTHYELGLVVHTYNTLWKIEKGYHKFKALEGTY